MSSQSPSQEEPVHRQNGTQQGVIDAGEMPLLDGQAVPETPQQGPAPAAAGHEQSQPQQDVPDNGENEVEVSLPVDPQAAQLQQQGVVDLQAAQPIQYMQQPLILVPGEAIDIPSHLGIEQAFLIADQYRHDPAFLESIGLGIFNRNLAPLPPLRPLRQQLPRQHVARKALPEDCPICLEPVEEIDDAEWCRTTCGQNYHRACVSGWAEDTEQCCVCRGVWIWV